MLLAAIDIGSNAVRLFFSHVFEKDGQIVAEQTSLTRVPIRLGEDVFNTGKISDEKIQNLLKTMQAFKLLIEVAAPVAIRACATSAMREAANKEQVVALIHKQTAIPVHIIQGKEEAELISLGFAGDQKYPLSLCIDVGGGSTDISLLSGQGVEHSESFKIGTVRMLNQKVPAGEWEQMQRWLWQFRHLFREITCVGTGGNINTIGRLYGNPARKTLSLPQLDHAIEHLQSFTMARRMEVLGLRPDRADVIVPAAHIFYFG